MTTNKDFWDNTLEHCSKEDKDYIASVLCKQIIYERDLAIQQLKDLGYGLGEKPKENKGDLISRQAVLNTLENADKFLDEDRTVENYKELLTECIKVLPSAENKREITALEAENKTLRIKLENAEDALRGLKEDLADARAELRERW